VLKRRDHRRSFPQRWVIAAAVTAGVAVAGVTAAPFPAAARIPASGQTEATAPLLVSVAGDIACGTTIAAYNNGDGTSTQCRQKYTGRLLAGSDAVWTLGDHVYPTATTTQFNQAYDPTGWGQMKGVTYPAPGDHDYGKIGGAGYFSYFGKPAYYSFDMGGWHVISLDSEIDHSAGSQQEQWLRSDLNATTASCIAAYWGEPRWTSGKKAPGNASFDPFWQDLYAAHADLALSGDTHNYERFAKMAPDESAAADGIREFVVGTGGRSLVGFPYIQPTSEKRVKAFGVLKLSLQGGSYTWQFEDETSTVRDSGSATCN
jgi:acid phosphatase type 7